MSTYLRLMGGYKQSYLKGRSFNEIKELFDREMTKVNNFISMNLEAQESSTKRISEHLESHISKKQKVDENVEPVVYDSEELRKCIEIVPDDGDEDNIQAMMDGDRLLAERLQAREREEFFDVQKARLLVELIEKRKKNFAALRD
nr:hypothetical protein [Tanacetum cinerariifolium]